MDMEEQRNTTVPTKLRLKSSSDPHIKDDDETGADSSKRCTINNINIFIANIFFLNLARTALRAYLGGTIRTIERRFGFDSTSSGVILGLMDVMHIVLVLFLGYFGRTSHKPRLIGITSIFPAITGLLMAAPYFLLPNAQPSAPPFGVQAMFNSSSVNPQLMAKMMGQQPEIDPGQIAKMMGQQPGGNASGLRNTMGQRGIDPSQVAKMMEKLGASPGQMSAKGGPPGADSSQMARMMGMMPFGPGKMQMCTKFGGMDPCKMGMRLTDLNTLAYVLFIVAALFYGIGGPATMVLGVPYIGENTNKRKVDFSVGEFCELWSKRTLLRNAGFQECHLHSSNEIFHSISVIKSPAYSIPHIH